MLTFAELSDLAAWLRRRGCDVGVSECQMASRLLLALEQHGSMPSDQHLPQLLTPIFCSSAHDQASIRQDITDWLKRHRWVADDLAASEEAEQAEQAGIQQRVCPVQVAPGVQVPADVQKPPWLSSRKRLLLAASVGLLLVMLIPASRWAPTAPPTPASAPQPEGSKAGTKPQQNRPTTTEPQPTVEASYNAQLEPAPQRLRQLVAALIPVVLIGAFALLLAHRRKLALQAAERAVPPLLRDVAAFADGVELVKPDQFRRVAQELRRHQPLVMTELDAAATVRATVAHGGLFWPVHRLRKTLPAYLVLIDRAGVRDHQARWATELVQRLSAAGVAIERYEFNSDPRHCQTRFDSPRNIRTAELLTLHHDRVLVVFSTGDGFFNPLTGEPQDWLPMFAQWGRCVLATPMATPRWGYREAKLRDAGFVIATADLQGLVLANAIDVLDHQPAPRMTQRSYPALLSDGDPAWSDRLAPGQAEQDKLASQLKWFLGLRGYAWLSACALYPVLQWEVTLHLGNHLMPNKEELRLTLASLIQLPWFRAGALPPWLRQRLAADLSDRDEAATRAAYAELMGKTAGQAQFALEVAVAPSAQQTAFSWLRPWQRWQLRREVAAAAVRSHPTSVLRDYAFVTFMSGVKPARLSLELPASWRHLLEHGWWPSRRQWTAYATSALVLSLGAWQLVGLALNARPRVVDALAFAEFDRIVLKTADGDEEFWSTGSDAQLRRMVGQRTYATWPTSPSPAASGPITLLMSGQTQWTVAARADGIVWVASAKAEFPLVRADRKGTPVRLAVRAADAQRVAQIAVATTQGEIELWRVKLPAEGSRPEPTVVQPPATCAECPDMVDIERGSFTMGSSAAESGRPNDERPQRKLTVAAFSISKTEVTQGQWRAVMGSNPSTFKKCGDDCPVESVSWADTQAFLQRLNKRTGHRYRLPSEAEWEYAARASRQTIYPWGNSIGSNNANCAGCGSPWDGKSPAPVGKFASNSWNVQDMIGNVSEWVQDCYDEEAYKGKAPTNGRAYEFPSCQERVLRGGSWNDLANDARVAFRTASPATNRSSYTGFRVAESRP